MGEYVKRAQLGQIFLRSCHGMTHVCISPAGTPESRLTFWKVGVSRIGTRRNEGEEEKGDRRLNSKRPCSTSRNRVQPRHVACKRSRSLHNFSPLIYASLESSPDVWRSVMDYRVMVEERDDRKGLQTRLDASQRVLSQKST